MGLRLKLLLTIILTLWSLRVTHIFISGTNPILSLALQVISVLIFFLSSTYITNGLFKKFAKHNSNPLAQLFGISTFTVLLLCIITGLFFTRSELDFQLHDTYIVTTYFHIISFLLFSMGFYTLVYHMVYKVTKRPLNQALGEIHLWLTTIGILLIPLNASVPTKNVRRYYSFEDLEPTIDMGYLNQTLLIIAMLVIFAQLIFLVNLLFILVKKS